MKHLVRPTCAIALLVLSVGCGDDGGTKTKTVEDAQTIEQGKTTGQTSNQLATLDAGADQNQAQGPISAVGNAMLGWVNSYRAAQLGAQAQGLTAAGLGIAQTVEGEQRIEVTEDRISADVTYQSAQASVHYVVELALGKTDDGGRTIAGNFDFDLVVATAQYQVEQVFSAEYRDLTLDSAGCPVGGGITLDYHFKLSGELFDQLPADARRQVQKQAGGKGLLEADFGPACGDVTVKGG